MTEDKELKDQRIPIMMTPSELQAIDDWSFKNRIRSRGEAIRRLCHAALSADQRIEQVSKAREELKSALLHLGISLQDDTWRDAENPYADYLFHDGPLDEETRDRAINDYVEIDPSTAYRNVLEKSALLIAASHDALSRLSIAKYLSGDTGAYLKLSRENVIDQTETLSTRPKK